jgi:diguanylate cyclase (GGDEF)-like protein
LAVGQSPISGKRKHTLWDRAHLRVVVPISVIVAVAIVCVVVAVLTSAQRADEVALDQERQLFTRAVADQGERVLREVESVTTSENALRNVRTDNLGWIQRRIGLWLTTYFDHGYVFVVNGSDQFVYALFNRQTVDPSLIESIRSDLAPLLTYLRSGAAPTPSGVLTILDTDATTELGHGKRMALVRNFMGAPALIAAVAVTLPEQLAAKDIPFVVAVKFINESLLTEISSHLLLKNLQQFDDRKSLSSDYQFDLIDDHGEAISRFAWTPKHPGSEIVHSVIPFIAVALAGFAVLAGFVLRYMRRTAAAIAAGEDRLRHLAMHDPLCGLPNRIFFGERLESVINEVRAGGPPAAVFYIDLDHFKDVNDTLGHPVGDELIRNVTLRLNRILRGNDLVARLGGDEFAVITSSGPDNTLLQAIAARIISALCAPYSINGQNIVIGASIGIAVIDNRTHGAADIMRYADMALYRAKNEGRKRACVYDAAMDEDLSSRKLLENDLREAIDNGELRVAYQPVVNNSGEMVVGVEALARWTHPTRGEIPPSEFIPVAEHSGLIIALGEWVLRRACIDGKAWPGIIVAVNVSPLQFRRTDFVEMVERVLAETGFDAFRLELEVTESTFIGNLETAETAMRQLKALGVRLALDDFGTGYSSLLYLRRFPFDKLKIDRSFVLSIEQAADAAAIVHAVVSLGRGLGMKVTAEGVETAEQHLFLRAAGVHTMQGYRFGKAVSPTAISVRLASPASYRAADDVAEDHFAVAI